MSKQNQLNKSAEQDKTVMIALMPILEEIGLKLKKDGVLLNRKGVMRDD